MNRRFLTNRITHQTSLNTKRGQGSCSSQCPIPLYLYMHVTLCGWVPRAAWAHVGFKYFFEWWPTSQPYLIWPSEISSPVTCFETNSVCVCFRLIIGGVFGYNLANATVGSSYDLIFLKKKTGPISLDFSIHHYWDLIFISFYEERMSKITILAKIVALMNENVMKLLQPSVGLDLFFIGE